MIFFLYFINGTQKKFKRRRRKSFFYSRFCLRFMDCKTFKLLAVVPPNFLPLAFNSILGKKKLLGKKIQLQVQLILPHTLTSIDSSE